MIKLLGKIPSKVTVAVSGGPDSMAVLHFLSRRNLTRTVSAAFFDHNTEASASGKVIVENFCKKEGIPLFKGVLKSDKPAHKSLEEYWRDERYSFFDSIPNPVITAHHLDDVLEWWIFSSCHGNPKLIPYSRGKYLRPFLLNRKQVLTSWCETRKVPYINDRTNKEIIFKRGYIRLEVVPSILNVNPGIYKVLKKKILASKTNSLALI